MNHIAKKKFGQNFLHDQNAIGRIVKAINPKPEQTLVEIGPGLGAISAPVVAQAGKLAVVEIDADVLPQIKKLPDADKITIYHTDALKFDFTQCQQSDEKLRVFGNLPYNISTPLIFHLLMFKSVIEDMHFMLQKEVVDRMCAPPGSKTYGRLSVMTQYYCHVGSLFEIHPHSFKPQPKVMSSIVRLVPHDRKVKVASEVTLENVVRHAFSQRRKTLRNALKGVLPADKQVNSPIDLSRRAETVSVDEYIVLADFVFEALQN